MASRDATGNGTGDEVIAALLGKLNEAQRVAQIGSWDWDMCTGEVWWSDETHRLFGTDPQTYVPSFERNAEFIHPDDLEIYRSAFMHCLSTHEPLELEVRLCPGDGKRRVCLARGMVVLGTDGTPARFVGTVQDITARKTAESERNRLLAAVEQAPEAVCLAAPDSTVRYVNAAFENLTGSGRSAVVGRQFRDFSLHVSDGKALHELREAVRTGTRWQGRLQGQHPTGARYTLSVTVSPVCDGSAQVVDLVIVARDITKQLDLESQLAAAQKLEAIGRLAGGVAHDFNNLLSVILNCADFARGGLPPDSPALKEITEIQKAGQRAAALTRQLLAFSRKQVMEPRVLSVNQVVGEMEDMLRRLIGEAIDLEFRFQPDLGQVQADPSQLQQVVMNLAVNARDAMPDGGKLTIETANIELGDDYADKHVEMGRGRYVMLAVSDTGRGFDAATRAQLFEPFFTTKEQGRGTGLGLSTVYGIVKQSDGHILVYSEPEHGATFKIYLPSKNAPIEVRGADHDSNRSLTGTETILLVEDEEAVRTLALRILQQAGYRVLSAPDGRSALTLAGQTLDPIDLLLTDVVLPQLSGRQLAEQLLALRPKLRVLYMSGYTDDAIVHHGVLNPGTLFIGKPFSVTGLARKVREALDQR
jgi:PAS domain S-box-containing protein